MTPMMSPLTTVPNLDRVLQKEQFCSSVWLTLESFDLYFLKVCCLILKDFTTRKTYISEGSTEYDITCIY
jgi:hypothetical protein